MTPDEFLERIKLLRLHAQEAEIWLRTPPENRTAEQADIWLKTHLAALDSLINSLE